MAPKSKTARRLHPRLRVLQNGSAEINASRSEISTTVAQSQAAAEADPAAFDLAAAQASTMSLSLEAAPKVGGRLQKRGHLSEEAPAENSFVNVIVEVVPAPPGDDSSAVEQAVERIARACAKQLDGKALPRGAGRVIRRQNVISTTIPIAFLEELKEDADVAFVQPAEPLKLDLPASSATGETPQPPDIPHADMHKHGADVLIGIIDVGGFDFAHPEFLDESGKTRFLSIWDQGGDFRTSPDGFDYGAEFTKSQLDAAIAAQAAGGLPAVEIEPQSQMVPGSHGTHVAGIAAGKSGLCPKAEIAAVLIDVPAAEEDYERRRETFSDSSRILHAVEYLLAIARARNKPLSINISLGTNGGAHDASGGVTRWLDMTLATPSRAICIAAGNAGQEKAEDDQDFGWTAGRIHASGRIPSRGLDTELEWVVIGNGIADVSENELEIWYSAQDRFIVELQPPSGGDWIRVEPQQFIENRRLPSGTFVSIYNELYHPTNGANYIALYLSPNLKPGDIRGVQSGTWRVRLIGEEIRNGAFHCWIERDDPQDLGQLNGQRFFRFPSFFSETSNVDSHSISSLACGNATIAVSNYNAVTNRMNISSSQGPTRDGRAKPDITAPGTDIVAANGFDPQGDPFVSKTGTSMASPYVAGVMGLMLGANPELTAMQCLGILQRTARPLPGGTYEWVNDAGFGRLDPGRAIEEASSFTSREDLT